MKIESQPNNEQQVKLLVEFDESELEGAKRRAARELAGRIKIPGFRPGKAPYPIVLRQVGEGPILEQAVEIIVNTEYSKILAEAGIHPYGPGSLENVVSTDPLKLEFLVPLEPEVTLGDYHSISREYSPKEVTETEHEQVIKDLLERQAVLEPVERVAHEGDVVTVKLSGERLEPAEGQKLAIFDETTRDLLIRPQEDDTSYEWPFKGFSRNLIGLGAGEGKTITHTFAEDYELEQLRGVEARYDFVVDQVRSRKLPELNDEFAASVGDYENLEALNKAISDGLKNQTEAEYNQGYDEAVLDELISLSTIKYPPQALKNEQDDVVNGLIRRLEQQGLSLELYLKSRSMDMDALRLEGLPVAEKRLKRSLVLMELAKQEKIDIDPQELNTQAGQTLQYLSQSMSKNDARRLGDQQVVSNIISNIAADMLTQKALERLRGIANGTYHPEEPQEEATQPENITD